MNIVLVHNCKLNDIYKCFVVYVRIEKIGFIQAFQKQITIDITNKYLYFSNILKNLNPNKLNKKK